MPSTPLEGRRHVEVTDQRTAVDYARLLKQLADVHLTNADARMKLKRLYPSM